MQCAKLAKEVVYFVVAAEKQFRLFSLERAQTWVGIYCSSCGPLAAVGIANPPALAIVTFCQSCHELVGDSSRPLEVLQD